jgi:hypothetical protein
MLGGCSTWSRLISSSRSPLWSLLQRGWVRAGSEEGTGNGRGSSHTNGEMGTAKVKTYHKSFLLTKNRLSRLIIPAMASPLDRAPRRNQFRNKEQTAKEV